MRHDTILHRLATHADERAAAPAYHTRRDDGGWDAVDWATYRNEVFAVAKALLAAGLSKGDRVCILGFNQPAWILFDVGAMAAGGVPAGIYTTCSVDEIRYIVGHADAKVVLAEDDDQVARVHEALGDDAILVVQMVGEPTRAGVLSWQAFLRRGADVADDAVQARIDANAPDDLATLIYTSGTTGPPKAVMLSHKNLSHTANVAASLVQATVADRMVSYLPLSHIAEQMFSIHGPITAGYGIYFARSMDTLLDDLQAARPTIVFAVPRVWEKMHAKVSAAMQGATGFKATLLNWAMRVGRQAADVRNAGGTPSGWLGFQYGIAKARVYPKVKAALGLDAARFGISGAAPISAEILAFFSGLDIIIHEVYGQSEGCGPTTFNRPGKTRYGTVGPAIPHTEVRIADDGEICLRGDNVFMGYLNDPEATADALQDGWLHSGDLGEIDDEGFLTITGRKKEIIITAGGKNIAPKNIEAALRDLPAVSQAIIIGDRRRFLSALLTLDPDYVDARKNIAPSLLPHEDPEVLQHLQEAIDAEVNPKFARVSQVRAFRVLPHEFSVEAGELTPTLKLKRGPIASRHADVIDAIYEAEAP